MTSEEFIRTAIRSAEIYHGWLVEKEQDGKGLSTIQVNFIETVGDKEIKLKCSKPILYLDDIQVKIGLFIFPKNEIQIKKYDRKKRELYIIVPEKDLYGQIAALPPHEIELVSDLKFLIKRVQEWYEKYKGTLCLPTSFPKMKSQMPELLNKPSIEQSIAYEGITHSPFSYIWGAPGTGKTQFVLSRAVLSYYKSNQPILITAPTNNAVDQTMKGVLSVLKEAGISFEKVLRIGVPGAEFYSEYPTVCENRTVEDELNELESQEKDLRKYIAFYQADDWCTWAESLLISAKKAINNLNDGIMSLEKEISDIETTIKVEKARFAPILSEIDRLNKKHKEVKAYLNKPRNRITAWIQRGKISQAEYERADIESNLAKQGNEHESLKEKLKRMEDEKDAKKTNREAKLKEKTYHFSRLHDIEPHPELAKLTPEYTSFMKIISFDIPSMEIFSKVEVPLKSIRQTIEDRRSFYKSKTLAEVRADIDSIQRKKEHLQIAYTKPIKDCLVVAATVDGYINKLTENIDFHPVHVFLDEAAYCPLIKSAVLLSLNVPVTLLGDHMQLPPICEMSDYKFNESAYMPVCLWTQSSLYLASAFSQNLKEIKDQYIRDMKSNAIIALPHQSAMNEYILHHTFRFGAALAKVLSHYVYTDQFFGNPNVDTKVLVIDVPKLSEKEDNVNHKECEAIKKYIQDQKISTNYAILTPYKNQQKALLSTAFSKDVTDKDEHVFTIHGSQGREWDIVIISIVTTDNGRWFLTPRLLNTAVSRAKKQLVIVCDATSYWAGQTNHIIGGLIAIADIIHYNLK